jgi:ParB family chromosome partitioning protein
VQELLADGSLSEGHGRALLGIAERGKQVQLARRVLEKGLSVRQVEDEVRRAAGAPIKPKARSGLRDSFDREVVDEISDAVYGLFGVAPRLKAKGDGGVLEVPFKDEAELRTIADRLRGNR